MKFVTSISVADFFLYGYRTLYNLDEHLPADAKFVIYADDKLPLSKPFSHRVTILPYSHPASSLVRMVGELPALNGNTAEGYDYRHNYRSFSKKVMAIGEALFSGEDPHLFWIDADTEFNAKVPFDFMLSTIADHHIACMMRKDWHMCTSFLGFNLTHETAVRMLDHFVSLYASGAVLTLPQWDDAGVLNRIIDENRDTLLVNDLTDHDRLVGGPENVFNQVFEKWEGKHRKGNLKYQQLPQVQGGKLPQGSRYAIVTKAICEVFARSSALEKRFLEIGTWKADRPVDLAKAGQHFTYYGFDVFELYQPSLDAAELNVKPHFPVKDVKQRLENCQINAELYQGNTLDTLPLFVNTHGNSFIDAVFIDGGHSLETMQSDFVNACLLVKEDGLIILDDYYVDCDPNTMANFGAQALLAQPRMPAFTLADVIDAKLGGGGIKLAFVTGVEAKRYLEANR